MLSLYSMRMYAIILAGRVALELSDDYKRGAAIGLN